MTKTLRVVALLLVLGGAAPVAAPRPAAARSLASSVEAVGMTVADMERSVAFYETVLGFEKRGDVEVAGTAYEHLQGVFGLRMRIVEMWLGDERLVLTEYLAPKGRPVPVDSRANDRWFQHVAIIVRDMGRAYAALRLHRVEHASSEPQRLPAWNEKAADIRAFYFKDPDGHPLEILEFPPDKGDPKWRRPTERLFLGIDHTAIVVADTDRSLAFYRDALGMRVTGESENHGPEQEHLNGVFGARLRITALRAPAGPGIELLEYLAPRDGRPTPADARANDVVHWQTTVRVHDTAAAAAHVRKAGFPWVSPGPIRLPDGRLGFAAGGLIRDPDGHAVQLVDG